MIMFVPVAVRGGEVMMLVRVGVGLWIYTCS